MNERFYCWICGGYNCKDIKYHKMLKKQADEKKHKNPIWKCFRLSEYCKDENGDIRIFNGGMSTDCLDVPHQYNCGIFGFEIYLYSGKKCCEIYKKKWGANLNSCNLHHYYYVSDCIPYKVFEEDFVEEIDQETLCRLVNKNWAKYSKFQKHKGNYIFLKEIKKHLIMVLENDKQIIFSKKENKYIPYRFYEFCIQQGYSW